MSEADEIVFGRRVDESRHALSYARSPGQVEDLMIDMSNGNIDYVVLSFGGALGIGNKLFAIPMDALKIDADKKCCVLNVEKERLKNAPGFDKDNWPNSDDAEWQSTIRNYYSE